MAWLKKRGGVVDEKELPCVPEETTPQKGTYTWIRQISIVFWLWEVLSLLASAACIAAILILLAHYNSKPLPTWSYGLTMNGLISLLAVVAKSAMVLPIAEALSQLKWCWFWRRPRAVMDFDRFDSASRGPWGSLMMLVHVNLWSVGAIGAALTLAALAIEPTLQQIPAYPVKEHQQSDVPIARAVEYAETQTLGWRYQDERMPAGMKGAVYTGLFGDEATIAYTPSCPTGNCTWPTFDTLGVCSSCHNLSSLLERADVWDNARWTFAGVPHNRNDGPGVLGYGPDEYIFVMDTENVTNDMPVFYKEARGHTIVDAISWYWPPAATKSSPPSGAFECILYFCVKTIAAAEIDGTFQEQVISTWPPTNSSLFDDASFHRDLLNSTAATSLNITKPSNKTTYSVSRWTFDYLRLWTSNLLTVNLLNNTYGGTTDATGTSFLYNDIAQVFANQQAALLEGEKQVIRNYTVPVAGAPDQIWAQLADSMTAYIRRLADPDKAVHGTAWDVQVFVSARWNWAILPLSLLVLTASFMVASLLTTARLGVPVWKSSSLAVLCHGLEESSSQALTSERLSVLESSARSIAVQMGTEKPQRLVRR